MSYSLFCVFGIFLVALLLSFLTVKYEAFIGSPNARRCGVDTAPCSFGQSCLNGWCVDGDPPRVPQTTGLPVLP
jgi:hypothetical protein